MKFSGKFKTCNLYNHTLHIIIWPKDGLRIAVELQKDDNIGKEIEFEVK